LLSLKEKFFTKLLVEKDLFEVQSPFFEGFSKEDFLAPSIDKVFFCGF